MFVGYCFDYIQCFYVKKKKKNVGTRFAVGSKKIFLIFFPLPEKNVSPLFPVDIITLKVAYLSCVLVSHLEKPCSTMGHHIIYKNKKSEREVDAHVSKDLKWRLSDSKLGDVTYILIR